MRQTLWLILALLLFCAPARAAVVTTQATANYTDSAGVAQPAVLSNVVSLTIKTGPKLKVTGVVTPPTARKGEVVSYVWTATNEGDLTAAAVSIAFPIPPEVSFVAGSFKINGAALMLAPVNGVLTVTGGLVEPGGSDTLSYEVTVK